MSPEITALATLVLTLIFALLIDRGAPNILESMAFGIESASACTVSALRRSAAALRRRHSAIERAHAERMAGETDCRPIDAVISSGSSSAAA